VWGGIELRELETIFALADELHFGRTAQRLGVSTAHVSQTIRHVERRLGGQLFERTSRRVELTLLGETLVENLRPLVTELGRTLGETAAMAAGLTGPLRIAHIMTVEGVSRLNEVFDELERRVPGVKILRLRFDILDYAAALHNDQVDIWLTWWPAPAPVHDTELGLVCGPPIATQPAVLLVGRSHPLAQRDSISLEDLVEHPLIELPKKWVIGSGDLKLFRERWLPATTPSGKPVPRVVEPAWRGHFHELATILERGTLGWPTIASFLDTVSMPRTVTTVPVRDAAPFVLVPWWLADRETPAIKAFAAIIGMCSGSPHVGRSRR
jgi:DNA-binding transcriptional LysR family regulator